MKLREKEFHWLSNSNKTRSFGTVLFWITPVLINSSVTFGVYILLGHRLSAAVVFTSLSAFRIIQDPVRLVPELLAVTIQASSSHYSGFNAAAHSDLVLPAFVFLLLVEILWFSRALSHLGLLMMSLRDVNRT